MTTEIEIDNLASDINGDSEIERWKPVVGWESYSISSHGRVCRNGRILKTFIVKGYQAFNVVGGGTLRKSLRVHREVARAFLPDYNEVVRHLDGDPENNHLSNLAWGTFIDNEADKKRHGRGMDGERHHQCKLTKEQVIEIRDSKESNVSLAVKFGVTNTTIWSIKHRRSWVSL